MNMSPSMVKQNSRRWKKAGSACGCLLSALAPAPDFNKTNQPGRTSDRSQIFLAAVKRKCKLARGAPLPYASQRANSACGKSSPADFLGSAPSAGRGISGQQAAARHKPHRSRAASAAARSVCWPRRAWARCWARLCPAARLQGEAAARSLVFSSINPQAVQHAF